MNSQSLKTPKIPAAKTAAITITMSRPLYPATAN